MYGRFALLAAKAVLSTIHIKHLVEMAPAEAWGDDFIQGVETYQGGPSLFVTHYATSEPPKYAVDGGHIVPVASGTIASMKRALRLGYNYNIGAVDLASGALPFGRRPLPRARRQAHA